MSDTIKAYQCRHVFADGHRCGSKSLRHEQFCFYHHNARKPAAKATPEAAAPFDIAIPEDRASIQLSIGEVLRRIARNEIDPRRAGLLLYGLQIASCNLPRAVPADPRDEPALVDEVEAHPDLGPVAPIAEYAEPEERLSLSTILLREFGPRDTVLPAVQAVAEPNSVDRHSCRSTPPRTSLRHIVAAPPPSGPTITGDRNRAETPSRSRVGPGISERDRRSRHERRPAADSV